MRALYELIHRLSPAEIDVVRNFLTCFSSNTVSNPEVSESKKLFEFILAAKKESDKQKCSQFIYGKIIWKNISTLLLRLERKILDALQTDICEEKKNHMDGLDYNVMQLNKKLAQYSQLLYAKPGTLMAEKILDESIAIGRKYEHFSELIKALKHKRWNHSARNNSKQFRQIAKEIAFYRKCELHLEKTVDYVYFLKRLYRFNGNPRLKYKTENIFKRILPKVQQFQKETKSALIEYYVKLIEYEFYNTMGEYKKAESVIKNIIQLVETRESVKRKERIGIAYSNLAECQRHLHDFANAVKNIRKGLSYLTVPYNYILSKEEEFKCLFYAKMYPDAEACMKELIGLSKRSRLDEFTVAKYNYMLSCALFQQENFDETFSILSENAELKEDKEGLEVSLRILKIMAMVELKQDAGNEVDALEKHIAKYKKKRIQFRERDILILCFLKKLKYKSFEFEYLKESAKNDLLTLDSNTPQHGWKIFSSELIPFHKWAQDKIPVKTGIAKKREKVFLQDRSALLH